MLLCLDLGNSHIYGGLFQHDDLVFRFRLSSKLVTSDELGIFLKAVIRENGVDPAAIGAIAVCSVVPSLEYSLRSACIKYFSIEPFFLQAGVKTGLNIQYKQPSDVGADRIANAIAGVHQFPSKNLIIIDFGTATTFCAINHQKTYFGGAILPGLRLFVEALSQHTAKLPMVDIIKIDRAMGRSTVESIQTGVFHGAVGACRELITKIKLEQFAEQKVEVLATGGFASLFDTQHIYDHHLPDLVLHGIRLAAEMNIVLV